MMFDLWGERLERENYKGGKANENKHKGQPLFAGMALAVAGGVFPTGGGDDGVHSVFWFQVMGGVDYS
jgi:hypothetical protein